MRSHRALRMTLLALALTTTPARADTVGTGVGKTSAFAAARNFDLSTGLSLVAQIQKGKSKNVLAMEATVWASTQRSTEFVRTLLLDVNGVSPLPQNIVYTHCQAGVSTYGCPLTGTWWLDLDAAEAANPGQFIGKPLTVTLNGSDNPPTDTFPSGQMTLSIHLVKK